MSRIFDKSPLDKVGIMAIDLQTRLKEPKIQLHNIQLVQHTTLVFDHLVYIREKCAKSFYLPTYTLEYVYQKLFDDFQKALYDKLLESGEDFVVYFTDTENYFYYFLSAESGVGYASEKFNFGARTTKKEAVG